MLRSSLGETRMDRTKCSISHPPWPSCLTTFPWKVMCLYVHVCFWQVLENYNKGKTALLSAAKIMVSPTEVDLNPETLFMDASANSQQPTPTTHHRRNSSVRLVHQALLWVCLSLKLYMEKKSSYCCVQFAVSVQNDPNLIHLDLIFILENVLQNLTFIL